MGRFPQGTSVRTLDIGLSANCIYPLIGHCEHGWHFLCANIASTALAVRNHHGVPGRALLLVVANCAPCA